MEKCFIVKAVRHSCLENKLSEGMCSVKGKMSLKLSVDFIKASFAP